MKVVINWLTEWKQWKQTLVQRTKTSNFFNKTASLDNTNFTRLMTATYNIAASKYKVLPYSHHDTCTTHHNIEHNVKVWHTDVYLPHQLYSIHCSYCMECICSDCWYVNFLCCTALMFFALFCMFVLLCMAKYTNKQTNKWTTTTTRTIIRNIYNACIVAD